MVLSEWEEVRMVLHRLQVVLIPTMEVVIRSSGRPVWSRLLAKKGLRG